VVSGGLGRGRSSVEASPSRDWGATGQSTMIPPPPPSFLTRTVLPVRFGWSYQDRDPTTPSCSHGVTAQSNPSPAGRAESALSVRPAARRAHVGPRPKRSRRRIPLESGETIVAPTSSRPRPARGARCADAEATRPMPGRCGVACCFLPRPQRETLLHTQMSTSISEHARSGSVKHLPMLILQRGEGRGR
jgi:hypothetical protein